VILWILMMIWMEVLTVHGDARTISHYSWMAHDIKRWKMCHWHEFGPTLDSRLLGATFFGLFYAMCHSGGFWLYFLNFVCPSGFRTSCNWLVGYASFRKINQNSKGFVLAYSNRVIYCERDLRHSTTRRTCQILTNRHIHTISFTVSSILKTVSSNYTL